MAEPSRKIYFAEEKGNKTAGTADYTSSVRHVSVVNKPADNDDYKYRNTIPTVKSALPVTNKNNYQSEVRDVRVDRSRPVTENPSKNRNRQKIQQNPLQRFAKRKKSPAKRIQKKLTVMPVKWILLSAYLTYYSAVQFPLALLDMAFIGSAATLEYYKDQLGIVGSVLGYIIEKTLVVVETITGIDLSILDPTVIFMAAHFIIILLSVIVLSIIYLSYLLVGAKPLFDGCQETAKFTAFLVSAIGLFFPFLNLIPWPVAWIWVVGKFPG